jgi:hypothetical protein
MASNTLLFTGNSNRQLADLVAKHLEIDVSPVKVRARPTAYCFALVACLRSILVSVLLSSSTPNELVLAEFSYGV